MPMRDVFYFGNKPNVHPREKYAVDLADARNQCTTEHFWIINEFCNYKNFDWDFDFDFLPDEDVWTVAHNNIWPSTVQKDSGTWLCPKEFSDILIYRADVEPLIRKKNEFSDCWKLYDLINKTKFDFSWHPDPTDPPYIYRWGCKFFPVQLKHCLEYVVPNAIEIKYMEEIVELLPNYDCLTETIKVDKTKFDLSWRPDPREPPYIYVWGNKYDPPEVKPTLTYTVPGATEHKYMGILDLEPEWDRWKEYIQVDKNKFDYSWRPDPNLYEPPYIYVWGNKYISGELQPTLTYTVPGATERKYMGNIDVLPELDRWVEIQKVDKTKFDFSWRPDPREPPYIYVWGNKYDPPEVKPTLTYTVPGATEHKYMGILDLEPEWDRWKEYTPVDKTKFDFSWRPDPNLHEPPYIYVWGNKYDPPEVKPTLTYTVPGATEYKYMGILDLEPEWDRWKEYTPVDKTKFDFSWRPDPNLHEPPYIYVWGNKYDPPEVKPTLTYTVPGATEHKYMDIVDLEPEWDKWKEYTPVDKTKFDFSWRPDPNLHEPPYIYVWGNKYVSAELEPTLEYYVPGATERKYMGNIDVLPEFNRWVEVQPIDKTKFDLSWRPDPREPPYIYVWGNKYIPGELKSTIEYHTPNSTERKYMGDVDVLPETERWNIVQKPKDFDLTWRPDPKEPPYIYVWGNKYIPGEIQSTIEYHTPDAKEIKYMGDIEVVPYYEHWNIVQEVADDFDLCWRPDPREPPYIYVWGNKYIPGEVKATIEYHTPNSIERKYMGIASVKPDKNWKITQDIDIEKFDLCWRPDPREPAYIYTWGNKYVSAELVPTIEYYTPNATERKYMGEVEVIPEFDRWVEVQPIDKSTFDMAWRPDPREPPYIYVWGNKHIPAELKPTLEYYTPNATDRKYMGNVEVLPINENWKITQETTNFDYTWRPDPREPDYIYVWGNKYIPGELKPTIEYICPNATEKKYMGNVEVAPEWDKYRILIPVDKTSFDFSWRPDPREPPYIYVWGNQTNSATIEPTIEYHCTGAVERKYMVDRVATTLPDIEKFKILIPVKDFDFSWRPDPHSPPYIYVFGNQWHDAMTEPTVEYHVPGAKEKKYITDIIAKVSPTQENWKTLIPVVDFDYSWRPNPHSTPYIYVFGNQWNPIELEHTVEYHTPGAKDYKYITDIVANLKPTNTEKHWKRLLPVESFDYSWKPDPREPALIYVFGNKWNDSKTEPTIEYHCEGATERKYLDFPVAKPTVEFKYWSISNNYDLETFDFSWRPNPHSPPQIYQWENNGPRYTVPGATHVVLMADKVNYRNNIVSKYTITTTLEDLIKEHPEEVFWALNPDLNYDKFDFSWKPNLENFRHINVFGNQYSKNTHTYYINGPMYMLGYREYNYVEDNIIVADTNLSMFFVDKSNKESNERFNKLKERYPKLQKTRYLNTWVDTINRCLAKSETKLCWILSSELDYSEFEFDFYPSPWQEKMVHVFGTQWSHWGNTYMVNKEKFPEDTKYVKIIEHLSCLNFVKSKKAKAIDVIHDIVYINHSNLSKEIIENHLVIDYDKTYLQTFKNLLKLLPVKKEHYIWLISSICDYKDFDFSYICDPFAKDQLHVFPSNKQKFGDTFFVDVNKLREQISDMNLLEDYIKINYNNHQRVTRLPAPEFIVEEDCLVNIGKFDYDFPYAVFKTFDNSNINMIESEPINLWSNTTKNILVTSVGGTRLIVPKESKDYIKKELYDYPYINKLPNLAKSNPLDIVFLSNGEKNAEENYEHLINICKGKDNRIVRVDGVNGRVAAYHAAVNASNTPWAFTVFAKLKVNKDFDWNWQPDRLQVPKHYIFHATNPLNNLEYGHQAMIAYNKKLVLANQGIGLDFTLDDEHEVVTINSGIANYNTDEFSTWRTAFREVIKLRFDYNNINKERLEVWKTIANGNYFQYSLDGAKHALEFYDKVDGDFEELKKSFEWAWCKEYFLKKYDRI